MEPEDATRLAQAIHKGRITVNAHGPFTDHCICNSVARDILRGLDGMVPKPNIEKVIGEYDRDAGLRSGAPDYSAMLRDLESRIRGLILSDKFGGESGVRVAVHNRAIEQALAQFDAMQPGALPEPDRNVYVWLIERGQAEGHVPPIYYEGNMYSEPSLQWTANAWDALWSPDKAEAERLIEGNGLAPATAVQHGFIDAIQCPHCDRWHAGALPDHEPLERCCTLPGCKCRYAPSQRGATHDHVRAGCRLSGALPEKPPAIDRERLASASLAVEEEDERIGVVGRGRKIDRIAAEYDRVGREAGA
jgi:hypothetical protein